VRTWFTAAAVALAASLALVPAASAQPRRPGPQVADRDAAREQARQKIRALRAMILVQELGLDEATAGKLGPALARHDDELARLGAERRALRKELRAALAGRDDSKIDGLVDKLVANQRARWDREQARFAEVRRLLTPRQAARLVEVLPQVDRRILQGLRRAVASPGVEDELDDGDRADGADGADDGAPPRRPARRQRRGR
jgi:hypothetical protein